jgi:putative SOS response-associated peptidase YedK
MCVNYITVSRQLAFDWFRTPIEAGDDWRDEIYRDHSAPFIIHDDQGRRKGLVGTYGFVPQNHRPFRRLNEEEQGKYLRAVDKAKAQGKEPPAPPRIPMDTMNARFEEVTGKINYKRFWLQQQLCIVPATAVYEPNWETGKHERWAIELASGEPFALPGMWRTWEENDGSVQHMFTHFTLNANEHPLLCRFHSDKEKRGVAILRPEDYDDWLASTNPEFSRALVQLYPADQLQARPAPKSQVKAEVAKGAQSAQTDVRQPDLF